jgi:hypothetical protein
MAFCVGAKPVVTLGAHGEGACCIAGDAEVGAEAVVDILCRKVGGGGEKVLLASSLVWWAISARAVVTWVRGITPCDAGRPPPRFDADDGGMMAIRSLSDSASAMGGLPTCVARGEWSMDWS